VDCEIGGGGVVEGMKRMALEVDAWGYDGCEKSLGVECMKMKVPRL
jgi:hypothetical protein